jgi:hypothetical protein
MTGWRKNTRPFPGLKPAMGLGPVMNGIKKKETVKTTVPKQCYQKRLMQCWLFPLAFPFLPMRN